MITIIAHRGFWKTKEEQNSQISFERAFDNGFGVETDLRDFTGEIVISHDIPNGKEIRFEEVLKIMNGRNLPLALNIKADGLSDSILKLLNKYNHTNYFTFDMSIPEMVVQNKKGLRFFTGLSDIIKYPIMEQNAKGIWLDSFYEDWFTAKDVNNIINTDKEVCVVSPELHGRDYKLIWNRYKNIDGIMLCTDYPMEARGFFNE